MSEEPRPTTKAFRVLGVDPGRSKCGLAVVIAQQDKPVLLEIVPRAELVSAARLLCETYKIDIIALGSGTEAKNTQKEFTALGVEIAIVDEYGSTLAARARYYQAKPPRGLLRFIPRGLLVPDEPIDDWAAVIIAERYLAGVDSAA
jgi:RNase H-fold protein (predicted Holliday junction resolvase)